MRGVYWIVGVAALGVLVACGSSVEDRSSQTTDSPWFVEQAAERGIDFLHRSGHDGTYWMPESATGGGALFDMDGDGDLDAYLVQSGSLHDPDLGVPGNQLYRNLGDGRFEHVQDSGAEDPGYGNGVACGDYDGDGDTDLYVTNVGPNRLLKNLGDGHFEDVTESAGVGHGGWGTSALFFDYDRDGDLDLFSLNYIHWSAGNEKNCSNQLGQPDYCSPLVYNSPAMDTLYRNDGEGRFEDVTAEAGMDQGFGNGLGAVAGDFNGDGWLDLFVANDGLVDQLWVNRGDGTFTDEGLVAGCAVDMEGGAPKAGMGVTTGDVDDDGDLDLMVCNLIHESDSVYRNDDGVFTDITARSGLGSVSRQFTRFGMGWVDFDNDGRLDLYQANGRVMRALPLFDQDDPYAEPNLVFRATESGRFQEVKPRGGTSESLYATSRGAAFGDIDGDGGVDVLVGNRDAPAYLLMNRVPNRGESVRVRAVERGGRDAEGAVVLARLGDRTLRRDIRSGYSYQNCNESLAHFGLGDRPAVDAFEVIWVDGTRQSYPGADAGSVVTLRRD